VNIINTDDCPPDLLEALEFAETRGPLDLPEGTYNLAFNLESSPACQADVPFAAPVTPAVTSVLVAVDQDTGAGLDPQVWALVTGDPVVAVPLIQAECSTGADCPDDGNECTDAVCSDGMCGVSNNTNPCDNGRGTCSGGICVPDAECTVDADCPGDGNECTDAVCNAGVCESENNTNACDGGAGTCSGGECVPNAEEFYNQNFESLVFDAADALSGDGWLATGNLLKGDGSFGGNFGVFAAPNASSNPGFLFYSAVIRPDPPQGGPAQGAQQLIVFNDYNCCGVDAGHNDPTAPFDRVEALVFREPFPLSGGGIPADRVGQRVTFFFEGKKDPGEFGLGGSTTAEAFIKVLDPGNDFQPIPGGVATVNTTNLPDDWAGFSISLDLTAAASGKLLQVGFQTIAQQGEPSTNIYDNTIITFAPTP
jgi:hypothetical protein